MVNKTILRLLLITLVWALILCYAVFLISNGFWSITAISMGFVGCILAYAYVFDKYTV